MLLDAVVCMAKAMMMNHHHLFEDPLPWLKLWLSAFLRVVIRGRQQFLKGVADVVMSCGIIDIVLR